MPLASEREVLQAACAGGLAVGGFNANSMEMIQGIIGAAEEMRSPVIVQVSPGAIRYAGLEMAVAIARAEAAKATVPVVLHLDHGQDFEVNQRCAEAGFGGLMFDGSELLLRNGSRSIRSRNQPLRCLLSAFRALRL